MLHVIIKLITNKLVLSENSFQTKCLMLSKSLPQTMPNVITVLIPNRMLKNFYGIIHFK